MSPFQAIELASVPASLMFIFTLIGLGIHVPESITGALQHFAAGILLCTIGTELIPTMSGSSGFNMNLSCFLGFFTGVAVMISLGILFPEHDHCEDDEEAEIPKKKKGLGRKESLLRSSVLSMQQRPSLIHACESQSLLSKQSAIATFPSALLFAIVVDSAMDGLLIGIAMAAGPSAGPMMAASLSVEMSFLGLTLAISLKGLNKLKSTSAALAGPVFIVLGATIGGILSHTFSNNPVSLAFLLSFGTSALLFMVAEELLLEAHEKGEHVWWVDLQLYTGFFASVVMGKCLK